MKTCSKCKIEKPKTEFNKRSGAKDIMRSHCRECQGEYYKANFEKISAQKLKYSKENAEKIAEYQIEYRKANAEKIAERQSEYYKANQLRFTEYRKANAEKYAGWRIEYRKANPEKHAAYWSNRRARNRNAEGSHAASDIRAIFDSQRGLCANCQTKLFKSSAKKYHVDHIMPLALGGSNWPSNLQCLCSTCNLRKSAKHPGDWAKENGRLI